MDFESALEFAVISAWDDLVEPNDNSSIHVEYANVDGVPVAWLEVWATYKGHGKRVCDYSAQPSNSLRLQGVQFANSYSSHALAEALDCIMQNQAHFTRPAGRGVNGLVQVGIPSKAERAGAAERWQIMLAGLVLNGLPSRIQSKSGQGIVREIKIPVN